jgi:hypothetical protein
MSQRTCGSCSLCCKVIGIAALDKPAGQWCPHFAKGVGCAIYASAPDECHSFNCTWLVTPALGEAWRPDRCKLVMWTNRKGRLIVDVDADYPNAWRREPHLSQLKAWADRSGPEPTEVLVRVRGRMIVVFPEIEIDLGPYDKSLSVASGYRTENGRQVPYAAFVPATR